MATFDQTAPAELPKLQLIAPTPLQEIRQGELFARLMLRQLPVMKYGPEDELPLTRIH